MSYSENPAMVRVDFFKKSGKWYTTEAVEWLCYTGDIHEAFRESVKKDLAKIGTKECKLYALIRTTNTHTQSLSLCKG